MMEFGRQRHPEEYDRRNDKEDAHARPEEKGQPPADFGALFIEAFHESDSVQ